MPTDSDKVTFQVRRVIKAEALNGKTPDLSKAVISKTLTENASMLNKDKIICSVGLDDNDI
jgi:hypothetical protein